MRKWPFVVVALTLPATFAAVASAAADLSVQNVVDACAPVIDKEYHGDKTPWGECVASTKGLLDNLVGPPATSDNPDKTVGDLVFELAKLYRDGNTCKANDTELPDAIRLAASYVTAPDVTDTGQKALIIQIGTTIASCQAIDTGAVTLDASSVSPN